MRRAIEHTSAGHWPVGEASDAVTLDYDARFRRRMVLHCDSGREVLLLEGGGEAWSAAGLPLQSGMTALLSRAKARQREPGALSGVAVRAALPCAVASAVWSRVAGSVARAAAPKH